MPLLPLDFLTNFHFIRPVLLLGLIPAILLVFLLRYLRNHQSSWNKAIAPELLPYLLDKTSTPKQRSPIFGLLLIWSLSCFALAGPAWQQIPVPVQEKEDALVIILDMSLSMYSDDLSPNRLIRAQRKLIDVLSNRDKEGQTALVVYAGDAHAVTPLTDDIATINNLATALTPNVMPVLGSNPEAGITLALELLENSMVADAQLLLITDGIKRSDIKLIQNRLEGTQHNLAILGVGTENGAPIPMDEGGFLRDQQNAIVIPRLQSTVLRELASTVGGRYNDITITDQDILSLLNQGIFEENEELTESEREFDSWDEAGPWLLLLALPFAALAFRRGWLLSVVLLVTVTPDKQAYAWEWSELWNNSDQLGSQTFDEDNFDQAASLFKDDAWRAAANYRNGDYEQALADLALKEDIESVYNRGNSLAKLERFQEAIEHYEHVLAENPEHADAKTNKDIVSALLEQQEQEEQEEQDSSGENQDQEEQDSDQEQEGEQQQQDQQEESEQSGDQQDEQEQEGENPEQNDPEQQEGDETEEEQEPVEPTEGEQADAEQEQAMQQYLNRIKDDPGELLRNKFRYQSQRNLYEKLQNPNLAEQEADKQIW